MKTENLQVGQCPKCGSVNLDFGCSEPVGDSIKYPFSCEDCKFEGIEWYDVSFSEMTTADGEEIEQEERIEK